MKNTESTLKISFIIIVVFILGYNFNNYFNWSTHTDVYGTLFFKWSYCIRFVASASIGVLYYLFGKYDNIVLKTNDSKVMKIITSIFLGIIVQFIGFILATGILPDWISEFDTPYANHISELINDLIFICIVIPISLYHFLKNK